MAQPLQAQPPQTEPRKTLMRWVVGTSLNYRFLVVAIGALLMVFGIATLPSKRVAAFPEFAPPRVVIQTACLGLSPPNVRRLSQFRWRKLLPESKGSTTFGPSRYPNSQRSSSFSNRASM